MDAEYSLADRKCVPCQGGVAPLKDKPLKDLYAKLGDAWRLVDEHHIEKEYSFADFKDALAFTNKVGCLAENEGHHPDINLGWGYVKISLWTHKIDGLSESDFIFAAKTDRLT